MCYGSSFMTFPLGNFEGASVKGENIYNISRFKQNNSLGKIPTTMKPYSMINLPTPIHVNTKLLENLDK